jgi:hypothetical protein
MARIFVTRDDPGAPIRVEIGYDHEADEDIADCSECGRIIQGSYSTGDLLEDAKYHVDMKHD